MTRKNVWGDLKKRLKTGKVLFLCALNQFAKNYPSVQGRNKQLTPYEDRIVLLCITKHRLDMQISYE